MTKTSKMLSAMSAAIKDSTVAAIKSGYQFDKIGAAMRGVKMSYEDMPGTDHIEVPPNGPVVGIATDVGVAGRLVRRDMYGKYNIDGMPYDGSYTSYGTAAVFTGAVSVNSTGSVADASNYSTTGVDTECSHSWGDAIAAWGAQRTYRCALCNQTKIEGSVDGWLSKHWTPIATNAPYPTTDNTPYIAPPPPPPKPKRSDDTNPELF